MILVSQFANHYVFIDQKFNILPVPKVVVNW